MRTVIGRIDKPVAVVCNVAALVEKHLDDPLLLPLGAECGVDKNKPGPIKALQNAYLVNTHRRVPSALRQTQLYPPFKRPGALNLPSVEKPTTNCAERSGSSFKKTRSLMMS